MGTTQEVIPGPDVQSMLRRFQTGLQVGAIASIGPIVHACSNRQGHPVDTGATVNVHAYPMTDMPIHFAWFEGPGLRIVGYHIGTLIVMEGNLTIPESGLLLMFDAAHPLARQSPGRPFQFRVHNPTPAFARCFVTTFQGSEPLPPAGTVRI